MSLYDILACPLCKVAVVRQGQILTCTRCERVYPIVDDVPVLFPDGHVPAIQHEAELALRTGYNPWIERLVMQSLPPGGVVLDLGAGNMGFSLPHVVRMDVTLTPYVDVVGDAHALPFLPGSFDFIFSLAVIEHLRQPFVAAQEMYAALRNGGYVYGECNFVFPYHGYPHHYFGMTQQGIEQVFQPFDKLRSGVATYQMPSFAVRFVLESYRQGLGREGAPDVSDFHALLQNVLDQPLGLYDSRFSEDEALRTAAGVFFFGVKSAAGSSDVIPAVVQAAWRASPALQARFPNWLNLGVAENLMLWAKQEGRNQDPAIAAYLDGLAHFRKQPMAGDELAQFEALAVEEAAFGHIPDSQRAPALPEQLRALEQRAYELEQRIAERDRQIALKNEHIAQLEGHIRSIEGGRLMRLLRALQRTGR